MNKLRAIRLFVRLADLGSFTKVADETNQSKSLISKEISRLEDDLGTRLLQRSTRNLQLTHIGEGYLHRCREILNQLDDAESFVQDQQDSPKGKLKINAPMALGLTDLSKLFSDFMREYPEIELDIHLGDEQVDLIQQGFDVGFRASSTTLDSNYVGRPLISFGYHICVSQDYFDTHPEINKPEDLIDHNCFMYSYFPTKNVWPLGNGVAINGTLRVNSTIFMLEAIKNGQGIGFIPNFVCKNALESGEIKEILADAEKPELVLYVLYPARHFVPFNLQHCIGFFEKWFKENKS